MSFSAAVAFVLAREGSDLVQDPNDPGGLSRYGIALKRHPELTADDIRTMTPDRARAIYSANYWQAIAGDELPERLQLPMLDCAVVQGSEAARELLQRALYLPLVDGKLGPGTLGAARRADPVSLLASFTQLRIARFEESSEYPRYGAGWTRRAVLAALSA